MRKGLYGNEKFSMVITAISVAIAAFIVFSAIMPGSRVSADTSYGSWVRDTDAYKHHMEGLSLGTTTNTTEVEKFADDEKPHTTEKEAGKVLYSIGVSVAKSIKGIDKDGNKTGVDASISGIVLGNVVNGSSNYMFDLSGSNIYGIFGAILYAILRVIALSVLFIVVLTQIVKTLLGGDVKGMGLLKDTIYSALISMILLFAMPQIVDWACAARDLLGAKILDFVTTKTGNKVTDVQESLAIEGQFLANWNDNPNFTNALMFCMSCFLPIPYLVSYIRIAVQQTIMFGLYPVFEVLSVNDKKLRGNWMGIFFTNVFVPTIDMALLLMPITIIKAFEKVAGDKGGTIKGGVIKLLIAWTLFTAVIPTRNLILNALGNAFGMGPDRGLFGALSMGARAATNALMSFGGGIIGGAKKASENNASKNEGTNQSQEMSEQAQKLNEVGPAKEGNNVGSNASDAPGTKAQNEIAGMEESREKEKEAGQQKESMSDPYANNIMNPELNEGSKERFDEAAKGAADDAGLRPSDEKTTNEVGSAGGTGTETKSEEQANDNNVTPEPSIPVPGAIPPSDVEGENGADSTETIPNGESMASPDLGEVSGREQNTSVDALAEKDIADMQAEADRFISGHERDAGNFIDDANKYNSKSADDKKTAPSYESLASQVASNSKDAYQIKGVTDKGMQTYAMNRAANLNNIDSLKSGKAELQKSNMVEQRKIARHQDNIAASRAKIEKNNESLSRLESERRNLQNAAKSTDPYVASEAKYNLQQVERNIANIHSANAAERGNIADANNAIKESKHNIEKNSYISRQVDQKISDHQAIEKQFATISKNYGMDGRTYGSAKEYSDKLQHDARVMKNANYREFQTGKYEGVMSPAQKNEFQRQVNTREAWKTVGAGVGRAAGIAVSAGISIGAGMLGGIAVQDTTFAGIQAQSTYARTSEKAGEIGQKIGGGVAGATVDEVRYVNGTNGSLADDDAAYARRKAVIVN